MRKTFDLIVIGGGVAGAAAALSAAETGARTALVRAGPGATALTSGAWNGRLPERLGGALASAGVAYEPCTRALPHPSGDLRPSDHAPPLQARARVDDDVLICGIVGLAGFHAPALARLWGEACGVDVRSATLRVDGTPRAGWSPVSLAAAIEREPLVLARPLAAAVREHERARVILPAVLGFDDPLRVAAMLRDAAQCDVAEALAVLPSIPGWRLATALERALRAAGVEIIAGRATLEERPSRAVDTRIDLLTVETSTNGDGAGKLTLSAAAHVLATGKFAAGGIRADIAFRETALGCPVWVDAPGGRIDAVEPLTVTSAQRLAAQPILAAGVRTDEVGRPIDENGDIVYENVWTAGSVRAGTTTVELGLGAAAEDGTRAATRALEQHGATR